MATKRKLLTSVSYKAGTEITERGKVIRLIKDPKNVIEINKQTIYQDGKEAMQITILFDNKKIKDESKK